MGHLMADPNLAIDRQIAKRLGRTWPAFFERYGRLTSVQREVIPPILDGESVLVSSATASGKTEAACAPLLERRLARTVSSTVLYVSPTRALVNDLFERLAGPCGMLSMRLERRTGEHKGDLSSAPDVLITTPESFDSVLCRGRTKVGHAFANVSAVILDEIHLLDGTPRGEHARWLLERLRRLRGQAHRLGWADASEVQIVALSATVAEPEAVRDRYLPGGTCIDVGGQRELEEIPIPASEGDIADVVAAQVRLRPEDRKIVIFCNERKRVDELAKAIKKALADSDIGVYAHHGSLSKRLREEAERDLKSDRRVVVAATSTLEIGIDVGDIDLVILDGPAPNVSALLQRIGRGNRRTGTTRLMAWSENEVERLVHGAMLAAARSGTLGEKEFGPQYGVIRQQIASYVFQARTRKRKRSSIEDLVAAMKLDGVGRSVLLGMLNSAELRQLDDDLGLGQEMLDAASEGRIHSTIEDGLGSVIVDAGGAGEIASNVEYLGGTHLGVAGKDLKVETVKGREVSVRQTKEDSGHLGAWKYASSPWFNGVGQPQAVKEYLGLTASQWPYVDIHGVHWIFHFGGSRRGALLGLLDEPKFAGVNGWFAATAVPIASVAAAVGRGPRGGFSVARIEASLPKLERVLGRPRGNRNLPSNVRVSEVQGWLAVDLEADEWATASIVPAPKGTESFLRLIAQHVTTNNRLR